MGRNGMGAGILVLAVIMSLCVASDVPSASPEWLANRVNDAP